MLRSRFGMGLFIPTWSIESLDQGVTQLIVCLDIWTAKKTGYQGVPSNEDFGGSLRCTFNWGGGDGNGSTILVLQPLKDTVTNVLLGTFKHLRGCRNHQN